MAKKAETASSTMDFSTDTRSFLAVEMSFLFLE